MKEYHSVGNTEKKVVSSSSFSTIDPTQGGYPQKYVNFFKENEEVKEKTTLKNGRLVHSYIEKPESFAVAPIDAPTDMMLGLLDRTVLNAMNLTSNTFPVNQDIDIRIISDLKGDKADAEVKQLDLAYEKLAQLLKTTKDNSIRAYREASISTKAYKAKRELTVLSDIIENKKEKEYINFLTNTRDKIVLNAEDKEKVVGAVNSLTLHPIVSKLLGLVEDELGDNNDIIFKELPIFWEESVMALGDSGIIENTIQLECKALLDRLVIDHNKKIITYTDLKTTGHSIYTYQSSFEFYRTYRQVAFYTRAIKELFKQTLKDKKIEDYKLIVNIVPVETFGHFLTTIYGVSPQWLFKGRSECANLLSRVAYHEVNGYNASYEEIIGNGKLQFENPK